MGLLCVIFFSFSSPKLLLSSLANQHHFLKVYLSPVKNKVDPNSKTFQYGNRLIIINLYKCATFQDILPYTMLKIKYDIGYICIYTKRQYLIYRICILHIGSYHINVVNLLGKFFLLFGLCLRRRSF